MDLFDEGEVTTADKIDRPQRALDREAIDDFMKRNPMAGGGMLVQPGFGGTRQGYKKSVNKGGRPIAKTGSSAYIREVLGKLPKGGRFDAEALARDIIQKFPDSSKSFIDKRDGSVSTSTIYKVLKNDKSLSKLNLKPYTQAEKTIIRAQNFIDNFIKENDRNPTVGEVKVGANIDPTYLKNYKETGKITGMQDTVFDAHKIAIDYILKNKNPSIKELQKLIGNAPVKNAQTLLSNVYLRTLEAMRNRAAGIKTPRSIYKDFSIENLNTIKEKVRAVPGYKDIYSRQIEDLVSEAYKGQDKKLKTALKKIGKFKKLNQDLQKLGVNLQLDHPLSYDFVKKAKGGVDPEELIRVKPIPDRVNLFKSNLDNKLIEISDTLKKQPANKDALNLYQDIQSIAGDLQIDVGKISKAGNIISAQAAKVGDVPLLPDVRKGAERQNAFREFVKNVSNDPRIQRLGINLKELKNLAKLPKVDVAKYDAAVNKFIRKSGTLALPFAAGYFGIKELSTPATAADGTETKSILPEVAAGTAAAGTLGTKTGRNIAGRIIGGGLGPTGLGGLTLAGGGYDLSSPLDRFILSSEAAFAPELVKGTIGATKGMKNRALQKVVQRALNLGMSVPTALKVARVAQPLGIMGGVIEGSIAAGKNISQEANRIADIKDSDLQQLEYENLIKNIKGFAGGGILKQAGDRSGPPPESGPMSQGLQGLMKRGMKI